LDEVAAAPATAAEERARVLAGVADILEEVSGVKPDDVREESSFGQEDLDVDSLTMVEVVVAAEDHFKVRISDDVVSGLKRVSDLVDVIAQQTSARAGGQA
jgi:acyl carrier protein